MSVEGTGINGGKNGGGNNSNAMDIDHGQNGKEAHSFTHSLTRSLTPSLTYSLIYSSIAHCSLLINAWMVMLVLLGTEARDGAGEQGKGKGKGKEGAASTVKVELGNGGKAAEEGEEGEEKQTPLVRGREGVGLGGRRAVVWMGDCVCLGVC